MHCVVKKLLLLFIFLAPKLEKLFGLSNFCYRNKRVKVLSYFIIISFIILYPISWLRVLNFSGKTDSSTTMYARNLTFVFNWLLLVFIFANETFDSDDNQREFESIERLFRMLIELQSVKDNLVLLMRCTVKLAVFVGLMYTSYGKYEFLMKLNLSKWEEALTPLLYLPFVILYLASSRIYAANIVVKHFLKVNENELKALAPDDAVKIKLSAINYKHIHEFFAEFNKRNAINLLVIISFCLLNIVYQAYFYYIQLSTFKESKKPAFVMRAVTQICVTYITVYLFELFTTIQVYDDIKTASCTTLNRFKVQSETNDLRVK